MLDQKTDDEGAKSTGLRTAREDAAASDDGVFVRTAGGRKVAVEICMKARRPPARPCLPMVAL